MKRLLTGLGVAAAITFFGVSAISASGKPDVDARPVTVNDPAPANDSDGNYVKAPATRAQADLLILHGGHYVLGKGHYLFDDDALVYEAIRVAKQLHPGKHWIRAFEDEHNGLTFVGAYNENTGRSVGIEVSGQYTLSISPITEGAR